MHPATLYWWKYGRRQRHAEWGAWAGCAPATHEGRWDRYEAGSSHHGDYAGGAFGVRRPLRFLAYKLELDDTQIAELARILDELKTERAQAEVDSRRTVAALADAVTGDSFDSAKAAEGAALRVKSAERLRDAVVTALGRIHALLEPAQRERLAYLIRTGALSI
jgi:Spy/CpxP family protein refolding chaperone